MHKILIIGQNINEYSRYLHNKMRVICTLKSLLNAQLVLTFYNNNDIL